MSVKWNYIRFGDLFDYENKSKIKAGDGLASGSYPFYTSSVELTKFIDQFQFDKNSLIFGTGGNASIHYCDKPFSVSTDCLVAFAKDETKVYPKYVFYYLSGNINLLEEGFKGAGLKHISKGYINEIQIPLPPLATQKRIAEILDTADALRRKDQELLKKYDELAQAIFIDMFGDPVKNEKGWEVKRIGEISKIKGGKRLPLGDKLVKYNTGLPYIKAGNIKSGKVNLSDLEYLLPETQRKIKNYTVMAGDVCVTIVGVNIGDVGIVPKELDGANLTENAAKIIVNDGNKLNNVYLSNFWRMPFIQSEIKKRAMAVGVPKLALFRIEEIEIIIPPYSDQIKFNRAIEIINGHFNMSFQNQINSTNIFDSLIQKTFKGELVA